MPLGGLAAMALGVDVKRMRELRECGDFPLNGLERAASLAKRLASADDVRPDKAGDPARLAQVTQPSALQELHETMNVTPIDAPGANASNEAPVHSSFLPPDCTDAAE